MPIEIEDVLDARERIAGLVNWTPIIQSEPLSSLTGVNLRLKAENLQKIGAFKVRGALNAVTRLNPDELSRGVITVSAGNHGLALSYAARVAGTQATVIMPETAVVSKIRAIEDCAGTVDLTDGSHLMERLEAVQALQGQIFIHPFDHPQVTAGQGTVGLEIADELQDLDAVIVPVGGGGLIAGVATAIKSRSPQTRVIGVEPEGSTAISQSLAAGRPVKLESFSTVADGLNAPWAGPNTFPVITRLVDEVVTVSDDEIIQALKLILELAKLLVEPAGATAVAALLAGKVPRLSGKSVVAVLSGGNVDQARLPRFLDGTWQ